VFGPFPALAELAGRVRTALAGADAFAWAGLDAAAGAVLWELVRRLPPAAVAPAFRLHAEAVTFAGRAQASFQAHLDRPVPVTTLARTAGMAARPFAAACRRHLGMSPLAAYTAVRIGHAAALLANGNLTVGEVAERLGFANPFHFSRVFRRHQGIAPSRMIR
jgi:transcriptional regulator GlxA family with amidase domain